MIDRTTTSMQINDFIFTHFPVYTRIFVRSAHFHTKCALRVRIGLSMISSRCFLAAPRNFFYIFQNMSNQLNLKKKKTCGFDLKMKQMMSHSWSICHWHCRITLCTFPRSLWCVVELSDDGCRRRLLHSSLLSTPTQHCIIRVMVEHHSLVLGERCSVHLCNPASSRSVQS